MFLKYLLSFLFIFASALAQAATFTVNDTGDAADAAAGNGVCATAGAVCTLRAAIQEANALAGADTIEFSIAGAGPHVIQPASNLPNILQTLTIDGTSEPSFVVGSVPVVVLSGAGIGAGGVGLDAFAALTLKGFNINSFTTAGLVLDSGSSGSVVQGNIFGLSSDGTVLAANVSYGIVVYLSDNNLIGGTSAAERNVVAGSVSGIYLHANGGGGTADNNTVQGNYIGTNFAGTAARANNAGISIEDTALNTIVGGAEDGEGNLISGNSTGVALEGAAIVQGNVIGLAADELTALGNSTAGIAISGNNSLIQANVLSGNDGYGIDVGGNANTIQGNKIGVAADGNTLVGNDDGGIYVGGDSNIIGGADAGEGNIIVANQRGLNIVGDSNSLRGNSIGLLADGLTAAGNDIAGLVISGTLNTIGGSAAGEGNVISGNTQNGITIVGETNTVLGNIIGLAADEATPRANGNYGIEISGNVNTIGGDAVGEGNVIAANTLYGILVSSNENLIYGNFIGTDGTSTLNVGNGLAGILLTGAAARNIIGDSDAEKRNVIAHNDYGIQLQNDAGMGNFLYGNLFLGSGFSIDLPGSPVDPDSNDVLDADVGANNLQNKPVLNVVTVNGAEVTVAGELESAANSDYTVYFYSQSTCSDVSHYGFAEAQLDSLDVTTDADGHAEFSHTFDSLPDGQLYISATANSLIDGTSEFSNCLRAPQVGFDEAAVSIDEDGIDILIGVTALEVGNDFTLSYAVTGGTAVQGEDFTIIETESNIDSGELHFTTDGALTQTLLIRVTDDVVDDDNETIELSIDDGDTGYNLAPSTITVTIVDNDAPDGSDNDDGSADSAAAASSSGGGCALVLPR